MEVVIHFAILIVGFTAIFWGYEIVFNIIKKREKNRKERNENFNYDMNDDLNKDVFGDIL